MDRTATGKTYQGRPLLQIRNGMPVYDRNGKEIGKVDRVYLGSVGERQEDLGEGPATAKEPLQPEPELTADLRKAFSDDNIPDVLRERLLRNGFIRIDSNGLFQADRYVIRDQIAGVSNGHVNLKVTKDELVKR